MEVVVDVGGGMTREEVLELEVENFTELIGQINSLGLPLE